METKTMNRVIQVQFGDGRSEEITIRQLALRDYERAYKLIEDEMAITALICGKDMPWLLGSKEDGTDGVTPESYEQLREAARETNAAGFFVWAHRKGIQVMETMRKQMEVIRDLPTEAFAEVVSAGKESLKGNQRPVPVPRR